MYNPKSESDKVYNYLDQLNFQFKELENFVKNELSAIWKYNNFEEARVEFSILNDVLLHFWKAIFNGNYVVSWFLLHFFQNFDRLDDISVQKQLFQSIKDKKINGVM